MPQGGPHDKDGTQDGNGRGHGETRVVTIEACELRATDAPWAFSAAHAQAIDAHWEQRLRDTPTFFNGVVHLLTDFDFEGSKVFRGRFLRTDFKSFLYWREAGLADPQVRDAFGSALITSADGKVLLGRQRAGNLNAGLTYPPGGFIDVRDLSGDGTINIVQSVAREITEETGLDGAELRRSDGFTLTLSGTQISIAVAWRSNLDAGALARAVRRHIEADPAGELADVVMVSPGDDLSGLAMPDFARELMKALPRLKTPS
jgi:8-oxo-dGTP pyrophosphatase MutT (NUDIX family)